MKKFFVFLAVLVLLATTAAAEINWRGELRASFAVRDFFNTKSGENETGGLKDYVGSTGEPNGALPNDKGDLVAPWLFSYFAPYVTRVRIRADIQNSNGTFGGFFRLHLHPQYFFNATTLGYLENQEPALGNVWWKPNNYFKATFGYFAAMQGGMIGRIYLCDEVLMPVAYFGRYHNDRYNSSWTNRLVHAWGWEEEAAGLTFEAWPTSGLYIVATLPLLQEYRKFSIGENRKDGITDLPADPGQDERGGSRSGLLMPTNALDVFQQFGVRVTYNIRGVGQLVASYDGGTGSWTRYSAGSTTRNFFGFDARFINAHLNTTLIKNVQLSAGVEIPLPITNKYFRGNDLTRSGLWDPKDLLEQQGEFRRQFPYGMDIRAILTLGDFQMGMGLCGYFGGFFDVPSYWYNHPSYEAQKARGLSRLKDPWEVGLSLNPIYHFLKIDLGIVLEGKITEGVDTGEVLSNPFVIVGNHSERGPKIDWNVVAHISTKPFEGATAWFGLQLRGIPWYEPDLYKVNGVEKHGDPTKWNQLLMWSIPMGIAYAY